MGEGLKRAFEAARATRPIKIGTFEFKIVHEGHGKWTARVQNGFNAPVVSAMSGMVVVCPTRSAMLKYLRYAYEGKEAINA